MFPEHYIRAFQNKIIKEIYQYLKYIFLYNIFVNALKECSGHKYE